MQNVPDDGFKPPVPPLVTDPEEDLEFEVQERQAVTLQASNEWELIRKWFEAKKKELFSTLTTFNMDNDTLEKVGERTVVYNIVAGTFDDFTNWIETQAKERKKLDARTDRRKKS